MHFCIILHMRFFFKVATDNLLYNTDFSEPWLNLQNSVKSKTLLKAKLC
jgi:hypothetical protein